MEFRTTATLITALFCSSTSLAATYQGEVTGTYGDWEENAIYDLQLNAYFSPVSTEGRPQQEAAFLGRASNFTLNYLRLDDEDDVDFANVDLNYYVPNSMFFLGGHFFRVKAAGDEFNPSYSEHDWGLTLGLAPADGLLISTKYRTAPNVSGSKLGRLISNTLYFENKDYQPNISVKYVAALDGGRAWKLETTVINGEYDDFLYIGGDYFIDSTFSLGLWMEDYDGSDKGKGIRTEKFVTSQLSFQSSYLDVGDANAWEIGARIRF